VQVWLTKDCWLSLDTTLLGVIATDCFFALRFGLPDNHFWKNITMKSFSKLLSFHFLQRSKLVSDKAFAGDDNPVPRIDTDGDSVPLDVEGSTTGLLSPSSTITMESDAGISVVPPPTGNNAPPVPQWFRDTHKMIKVKGSERKYCKAPGCNRRIGNHCTSCNKTYCDGEGGDQPRYCYYWHVCQCFSGDVMDPEWQTLFQDWEAARAMPPNQAQVP